MSDLEPLLKAAAALLQVFIDTLGVGGTLGVAFGLLLFLLARRIYNDWRKDREGDLAIRAYEESVQRSAAEAREYRTAFFKDKLGWSDDAVERFIVKNQLKDGPSARQHLEGGGDGGPKGKRGGRRSPKSGGRR